MPTNPPSQSFPFAAPPFDGRSRTVAAGNAFDWLKQGWALFVFNPAAWVVITVVLLLVILGLNVVPLVGSLAANLLTPLLGAGLLLACQRAADGQAPEIADLFAGFKQSANDLALVGVLYMAAMLIVFMLVLALGGGSVAGGLMMGYPAGVGVAFGGLMLALLLSLALSVPLFMALWFAPALIVFNHMSPLPALKASFNACLKNTLVFLVYSLVVVVLMFFAALPVGLGFLVLIPVLSGSVYASYRDIFVAN